MLDPSDGPPARTIPLADVQTGSAANVAPPAQIMPDQAAFERVDGDRSIGLLLVCDHASNALPTQYETLGLAKETLARHIGFDIGMRSLTWRLARMLNVPAVLSTYSRLLIDPNRGESDPTVLMRLSDGAVIPGNRHADEVEKGHRLARYYRPYHDAISAEIDAMLAVGTVPILISLHSFTPVWRGLPRPWHVGVLWDADARAVKPFLDLLNAEGDLVVGDNEPYTGHLLHDCMNRHGTMRGLPHALLEVRQDLVSEEEQIADWANRLCPILQKLNATPDVHQIKAN